MHHRLFSHFRHLAHSCTFTHALGRDLIDVRFDIRSVYASEDLYMSDNELSHDGSDAKGGDKAKKRKRSRSPSPDRRIKNQKKGKDDKKGMTPAGKGACLRGCGERERERERAKGLAR